MTEIVGSIDNAFVGLNAYHLVFTRQEMLRFLVMGRKEHRSGMRAASDPSGLFTISGAISNSRSVGTEVLLIISTNLARGREIEKNMDAYIGDPNQQFVSLDYGLIEKVELSSGTSFKMPQLTVRTDGKKEKYQLNHGNSRGRGRIPDEVFSGYENTLRSVMGDRVSVIRKG